MFQQTMITKIEKEKLLFNNLQQEMKTYESREMYL